MQEEGSGTFGLERVVLPFSALASWGIVAVGVLSSLNVLGVNIQPLLTVGGVGGLAVGFGAQAVTSNAISGINLVRSGSSLGPCACFGLTGMHPTLALCEPVTGC